MSNFERGRLVVVSGPSGVGKGTVLEYVLKRDDFVYSVSATTRSPRETDIDGVTYFFKTKAEFEDMIKNGELIEYAEYNGNYYGTPKFFVDKMLSEGKNVILEIEVKGAMQIKKLIPDATFIFIAPESKEILEKRLRGRGTEEDDVIANRLAIAENEVKCSLLYDYLVINRQNMAESCAEDIAAIVRAENFKPLDMFDVVSDFFE